MLLKCKSLNWAIDADEFSPPLILWTWAVGHMVPADRDVGMTMNITLEHMNDDSPLA